MIYFSDKDLLIRSIEETDPQIITKAEIEQGWQASEGKYWTRVADHNNGKSIALVAEYKGNVAGYINLYIDATEGSYGNLGYCEIVDFGVLEKYRGNGIGSKLMDVAEELAQKHNDFVYLGVGLHEGYGSAHRMYCKRGYIPDGKGVWYGEEPAKPYESYCNDDDLVLYFIKELC